MKHSYNGFVGVRFGCVEKGGSADFFFAKGLALGCHRCMTDGSTRIDDIKSW